ncbi:MAG: enoyl-CoA hydratase [Rhodospirillales bacterium]|nr:enoyl-CoA hydratase [Rhodospirillales bacterium]
MPYNCIQTETQGRVALITLDRPEALNAINAELVRELAAALDGFERDDGIGAIVLTGSEKAFAAGADIKEMLAKEFADLVRHDFIEPWECLSRGRKPIVAAVSGYALGGGCEIAMMCDIVLAADTARFGQPEILLGTFPGAGGTQRLPRAVGKAKAMEMVLTGRMMDAEEAERAGLVSRVIPAAQLLDEAMQVAAKIADQSLPSVLMAKESVNRAYQLTLDEGIRFERRLFQSTFAIEDRREGMQAFADKRKPDFKHR